MPCVWPLLVSLLKIVCCVWASTAASPASSAIFCTVFPPTVAVEASWNSPVSIFQKFLPCTSERIPALIRTAVSVPVVMKSATSLPSIVQAFAYGPPMPFVEKPMPFLFMRMMFTACSTSGSSMIRISSGSPSAFRLKTTYPPKPPVISSVACSIAFLSSLLASRMSSVEISATSSIALLIVAPRFDLASPNSISS